MLPHRLFSAGRKLWRRLILQAAALYWEEFPIQSWLKGNKAGTRSAVCLIILAQTIKPSPRSCWSQDKGEQMCGRLSPHFFSSFSICLILDVAVFYRVSIRYSSLCL